MFLLRYIFLVQFRSERNTFFSYCSFLYFSFSVCVSLRTIYDFHFYLFVCFASISFTLQIPSCKWRKWFFKVDAHINILMTRLYFFYPHFQEKMAIGNEYDNSLKHFHHSRLLSYFVTFAQNSCNGKDVKNVKPFVGQSRFCTCFDSLTSSVDQGWGRRDHAREFLIYFYFVCLIDF